MSNRIKVLALAAIAVVTAGIVWTAASTTSAPDQTAPPPTDQPSPSMGLSSQPSVTTYVDESLGPNPPQSPTGRGPQSMLWVAGGSWWAAMVDPKSSSYHIFELVDGGKSWSDTGTVIDERIQAQPDTLWDQDHGKLYVLTGSRSASKNGAARLMRYSFDAARHHFNLDPNFPITVTDRGFDSMVLGRDSTGKLWVTYLADDGQVMLESSQGDDLFWGAPFALPAQSSRVTVDDAVRVVPYGPGRIGVLWSSRAEGTVYFAGHVDGDPDDQWSTTEIATQGRGLASSQLDAIGTPDGRVFGAVATALSDDPGASGQSPQILLLVRTVSAGWTSTMYSRLQDQQGSPSVAFDGSGSIIYVMTTSPKPGGSIVYKQTLADAPSFDTGGGTTFIADALAPLVGSGTTTKQTVSPETGLVMLAWDPTSGRYVHGVMDLGRGVAAGPKPNPAAPGPGPEIVFRDTFDPWPVGRVPSIGWELRSSDPVNGFRIVVPNARNKANKAAALISPFRSKDLRACKAFPEASTGTVIVDTRVRLVRRGNSDAVITEVRGKGVVSASVRFGKQGTFAFFRGGVRVRTTHPVRLGFWYRSIVTVHLATKTYDWRLTGARGRPVIAIRGIAWNDKGTGAPLDDICLRSPIGGTIDWDDISVRR